LEGIFQQIPEKQPLMTTLAILYNFFSKRSLLIGMQSVLTLRDTLKTNPSQVQWRIPVTLAIWEAEI
jgi:hypothetical protein